MIENATSILKNLKPIDTTGKADILPLEIDDKTNVLQHLQYIGKSLDSIERNLSYQTNILYIDTFILSAIIFFGIIYKSLKTFI